MILVANLDCELSMARRAGQRSEPLSLSAQRTASALGTLLRAFASPGDRLWTLLPVDPDRLPDVEGLPPVELISGPLPEDEEAMFWGGTGEVEAAVNDRRFAAEIAARRGWTLPGSAVLFSIWAVENHVAAGGGEAAPGGRWVVRSPLAAAGRARVFGSGRSVEPAVLQRILRRLNAQDSVLFEPWMDRAEDIAATGRITDDGPAEIRTHHLHVDDQGLFRGVSIDPAFEPPGLLMEAAAAVGHALHERGYRGRFGVDAWLGRDADGAAIFQPLSEINARMTFGHVARKFSERIRVPRVVLRTHHGPVPNTPGVVPLLLPGGEDGTGAWLETDILSPP